MEILNNYCRKIGRDPSQIRRSWHGSVNIKSKKAIENSINELEAMANAGVQDFILAFEDRKDTKLLRIFAEEILPVFQ